VTDYQIEREQSADDILESGNIMDFSLFYSVQFSPKAGAGGILKVQHESTKAYNL